MVAMDINVKPTLFLHIGAAKAASSTIQGFLAVNAGTLADRGIVVLGNDFHPYAPQRGNPPAASTLLDGVNRVTESEERLAGIAEAFLTRATTLLSTEGAARKSYVYSAENIMRYGRVFEPLLDLFQIQVIFYVRRQDQWLESVWKQWVVKSGNRQSPFEWAVIRARRQVPAFLEEADWWRDRVGGDKLHVRPVDPKALIGRPLLEDFNRLIDGGDVNLDVENRNPFVDPDLLRFLQKHGDTLFASPHDNRLFNLVERLDIPSPPGRRLLTDGQRSALLSVFAEENERLLADYCPQYADALMPEWAPRSEGAELKVVLDRHRQEMADPVNQLRQDVESLEAAVALLLKVMVDAEPVNGK